MSTIISNSELQRNPGKLTKGLLQKGVIVTSHGKPKMLVVPYFEESDQWLEEYFESYEIWQNQKNLRKELQESKKSGISDLSL